MALLQESSAPTSVVTSPSGTAKSGSPFESALEARTPLEGRLRSTPRLYKAFSVYTNTPRNQRRAVVWQELEELECPLPASHVNPEILQNIRFYNKESATQLSQCIIGLCHPSAARACPGSG